MFSVVSWFLRTETTINAYTLAIVFQVSPHVGFRDTSFEFPDFQVLVGVWWFLYYFCGSPTELAEIGSLKITTSLVTA